MGVFLYVIIPTYNASGTVRQLAEQLERELCDYSFRIVFIDDASRDNTPEIILSLANARPDIDYFLSPKNQGQQASLLTGLRMIPEPCEYVVTMDDDLQHPVNVIPRLIEKIQEGYDLVYAIPCKSPSVFRRLGSRFRDLLFESFPNKPAGIRVSAFRILTYDLAMKLAESKKKFFYMSAEAFQYKIRAADISYEYIPRPCGRSGYNFWKLMLIYSKILLSYRRRPM